MSSEGGLRMSFIVVGHCPKCGAPLYSPMIWQGVTPPPVQYSCYCTPQPITFYSTNTSGGTVTNKP
jgi:hypothetical protein